MKGQNYNPHQEQSRARGGAASRKLAASTREPDPLPDQGPNAQCIFCHKHFPTKDMHIVGDRLRPGRICETCWDESY